MILLSLLLGLVSQQTQTEEIYRFGVEVRTVFVDVFVSHDGNPVTGLSAADFEIKDNGTRQEIDLVDPQDVFLSAMLILDTSASLSGPKLIHLRQAAHSFLRRLQSEDEAGLMMFNQYCYLSQGIGDNLRRLHEALDQPIQGVYTGLHDALYTGLKLAADARGRPMVVLFTDGEDNASWLTEKDIIDVARESEAIIHVIGISSSGAALTPVGSSRKKSSRQAEDMIQKIAKTSGGRAWFANTSADLERVFLEVLAEMETRYLLSYQLLGAPTEGWHELDVKLKNRKGETRARPGYMVTAKER